MAIRKYTMSTNERAMHGFTELYVMKTADFIINATTTHILCPLNAGDVVFPQFMLLDARAGVVGPTCTATLGVTGTVNKWIAATSIATNPTFLVPQWVAGNMGTPNGTEIAAEGNKVNQPYKSAGSENIVAQMVVSNTAITAGEVWFWLRIFRNAVRSQVKL